MGDVSFDLREFSGWRLYIQVAAKKNPIALAAACAASGVAIVVSYNAAKARWRGIRGRRREFEHGPVDITLMTPEASIDLCGVRRKGKDETKEPRLSLIPDALLDLEENAAEMKAFEVKPHEEIDLRALALEAVGAPPFRRFVREHGGLNDDLRRGQCQVLQINIGLFCNQACTHCHVESSPLRTEAMTTDTVDRCLALLAVSPEVTTLDITGGAPELNANFCRLVEGAVKLRQGGRKLRIIDRCNLTVLLEPGQEDLGSFLAKHDIDIIASLPSYEPSQTDRQRGRKVFERSIEALHILNRFGYGQGGPDAPSGRRLDLVFNPSGPFLPPKQELLDAKYRQELGERMQVEFNMLITITNMPVKRFFDFLRKKGTLEGYMDLLVRNFNPDTLPALMCKNHVSVAWDGKIYDCDFNQQLKLGLGRGGALDVFSIESLDDILLQRAPIRTAAHCYGCTAAQGSG